MRQEAQHLLDVLDEMLAPASATPTPQRLKLNGAMEALREAMKRAGREAGNGEDK